MTIAILFLAVLPNLPGFLANTFGVGGVPGFFLTVFQYSWFVGFGVAFVLYALCKPSKTISTVNG